MRHTTMGSGRARPATRPTWRMSTSRASRSFADDFSVVFVSRRGFTSRAVSLCIYQQRGLGAKSPEDKRVAAYTQSLADIIPANDWGCRGGAP